jgi:hypothetical protein
MIYSTMHMYQMMMKSTLILSRLIVNNPILEENTILDEYS